MLLTIWAASGSPWATVLDVSFQPRVTVPGVHGALVVTPMVFLANAVTGNSGSSALTIPIPANPRFVGSRFAMQSVTADPALTTLAFTNGLDFVIN